MTVSSLSVSLVIKPLSIVYVTIGVDEATSSIGFVSFPPTFVHGTVRPNLFAFSFADHGADDPFSVIFGLIILQNLSWAALNIGADVLEAR